MANNAFEIGDRMAERLGLGGSAPTLEQAHAQASALIDDPSAQYESIIDQLAGQAKDARRGNRGRALMEMGVAMMQARGPNFLNALGQGGAAGLAARDRIQQEERGLMQAVINAQMARNQAQNQHQRGLLEAATGLRRSDLSAASEAMSMGARLAGAGAEAQNLAASSSAQDRRLSREIEARAEQAALEREHQARIVRLERNYGPEANVGALYSRNLQEALERFVPRVGQEVPSRAGGRRTTIYTTGQAYRDAAALAEEMTRAQIENKIPSRPAPAPQATPQVATPGNTGSAGPRIISVEPVG